MHSMQVEDSLKELLELLGQTKGMVRSYDFLQDIGFKGICQYPFLKSSIE